MVLNSRHVTKSMNSTFLQLGFGLPWSKRFWFSMEITVEGSTSGSSITLGDIGIFGAICCWLKLTFFLSFGGDVFTIGFEASWGVVMGSEIISDVAVTANGWIWKSICGVIWKNEKFHEYPIFKGGNSEQFQESMTKLHENFVNLFGLGSLNNIYLGLFHSTLAPVTGKRSNRGETQIIGQWEGCNLPVQISCPQVMR